MRRLRCRLLAATILAFGLSALTNTAWAFADLVPKTDNLASRGKIVVFNAGDSGSGPTELSIKCQRLGAGGGCPEAPGMAAYRNPAYPFAATLEVPALQPGQSFDHQLAFWDDLVWAPGDYQLLVFVDPGGVVTESNESNNLSVVFMKQPFASRGLPAENGLGKLAMKGAAPSSDMQNVKEGQRLDQPDIIATPLGLIMKGGPVAWGEDIVLDKTGVVAATRQGPRQDLCRISPAAYRAYNRGRGDAGGFTTEVYRDSELIHRQEVPNGLPAKSLTDWHSVPVLLQEGRNTIRVVFDADRQVAESDERNTYTIRATVKIDCDGDGKAGDPSHGISG